MLIETCNDGRHFRERLVVTLNAEFGCEFGSCFRSARAELSAYNHIEVIVIVQRFVIISHKNSSRYFLYVYFTPDRPDCQ